MLSNSELNSFAEADIQTYDLSHLDIDLEIVEDSIEKEIEENLAELNSAETLAARFNNFKVEGTTEEDYRERLYKIDKNKKFIYGIRNFGGDRNLPFIYIQANFEISSKVQALSFYNLIKEEFNKFSPLYLSFQTKLPIDSDFIGSIYLVASTKDISSRVPWDTEDRIQFEDVTTSDYYEWYKLGYSQFHIENPELEKKVTLNNKDVMDDSLEQGLLKYIRIDNERAGIIAAENSKLLGHSGIYFNEIFLQNKWKGKGLAKAIQRKFISKYAQGTQFIWGTIDSNNLPSYKTAYSNGRRPIRYENFINLK